MFLKIDRCRVYVVKVLFSKVKDGVDLISNVFFSSTDAVAVNADDFLKRVGYDTTRSVQTNVTISNDGRDQ